MSKDVIIKAENIKKSYKKHEVLRGISLSVKKGEILAIMGPSGSGKSTLLHSLAGIIKIDSGKVFYDGDRLDNLSDKEKTILRRTDFGFIFQFSQLVPELTILDNVALPILLNGKKSKKDARKKAHELLEIVGIDDVSDKLPHEVSGGQAQRAAVARAMIMKPKVVFADEPTGSLDSVNSERVMELFVDIAKKSGTAVIVVTHEPTIAAYADREIIVRDGKL